jgi:hypothetical protein
MPDLSTFVVSVGDGFEGIGSIKADKCRVDQDLDIAAFFDLFHQVRGQSLLQRFTTNKHGYRGRKSQKVQGGLSRRISAANDEDPTCTAACFT